MGAVAIEHIDPQGNPKIVSQCSYPLTGKQCVDLIITDAAVIEVTTKGLVLKEGAPGWTPDDVQAITEPQMDIASDFREMTL